MILYINTTDFNKATFAVSDGKKIVKRSYKIDPYRSYEMLGKLDDFFKKLKISSFAPASPRLRRASKATSGKKNLKFKRIVVNKGPGSYTGVRVGVTMAQALGFAWGVPAKAVAGDKFKI